jgi:indolepyruvate ferredoxin oxidoreductase
MLIHQQECATELRRKRKRGLAAAPKQRIMINERVCEGCGDCGAKSNCLSVRPVETEFGRKTQIHQSSCNLDFSCVTGDCPSFVEVTSRTRRDRAKAATAAKPVPADPDPAALPTPVRRVGTGDFAMRISGVGGTGVVTVAQALAAAATRSGLQVAGLDQLGLAQKGGAVVSDVRFSAKPIAGSSKLTAGSCDLYLGCDILVASAPQNLSVMTAGRTYAVVSTSVTPTGRMITDPSTEFPSERELIERIEWAGHRDENVFVDARAELGTLGDDQYANVFLIGVAVQAGVLPLSPEDIEWALDLNGVQVARNVRAFRLGRKYAATRDAAAHADTKSTPSLAEIVARRTGELLAYQNEAYARRYESEVERVRAAEASALGGSTAVTEEFAKQLFKLMAYKDEYEVARLQTDPAFGARIREEFGDAASYSILLHPPILRAMGLKRKIKLRSWWARPLLRALYSMRGLRGTALDVFGYSTVRRTERALIGEYVAAVRNATATLSTETAPLVQELVGLPEWIRGYEGIKMRSVAEFRSRLGELSALVARGPGFPETA